MGKRAEQLARIEAALDAVVAAANANADEAAQQQIAILSRLDGLDGTVADLAEAVRVVMAARTGQQAADDVAEGLRSQIAAIESTMSELGAAMAAAAKGSTATQAQAGSAGTAGQPPPRKPKGM